MLVSGTEPGGARCGGLRGQREPKKAPEKLTLSMGSVAMLGWHLRQQEHRIVHMWQERRPGRLFREP